MGWEHDEDAIGGLLADWADAVKRGDVKALAGYVAEDAEFWTHGAPPLKGRPSVEAVFAPLFEGYAIEQEFELVELVISGDLAFMRGMETHRLRPRDGSEIVERKQRAFSILRRGSDGQWRFARGMTNLPPQ